MRSVVAAFAIAAVTMTVAFVHPAAKSEVLKNSEIASRSTDFRCIPDPNSRLPNYKDLDAEWPDVANTLVRDGSRAQLMRACRYPVSCAFKGNFAREGFEVRCLTSISVAAGRPLCPDLVACWKQQYSEPILKQLAAVEIPSNAAGESSEDQPAQSGLSPP